jgi:hypothetical protein
MVSPESTQRRHAGPLGFGRAGVEGAEPKRGCYLAQDSGLLAKSAGLVACLCGGRVHGSQLTFQPAVHAECCIHRASMETRKIRWSGPVAVF